MERQVGESELQQARFVVGVCIKKGFDGLKNQAVMGWQYILLVRVDIHSQIF